MKKSQQLTDRRAAQARPSFEVVEDQLYTARNHDGFEVEITAVPPKMRTHTLCRLATRKTTSGGPEVSMGKKLQRPDPLEVVVGNVGVKWRSCALCTHCSLRVLGLSKQIGRDPNKSGKDALQSRVVTELVNEYLPHFLLAEGGNT